MTVKELKKLLSEQDENNEVIFYNLDNNNLTEFSSFVVTIYIYFKSSYC